MVEPEKCVFAIQQDGRLFMAGTATLNAARACPAHPKLLKLKCAQKRGSVLLIALDDME
jgi:hypothetical protein